MLHVLLACTSTWIEVDSATAQPDSATAPADDVTEYILSPPARTLTAPAQATLDCAAAIPTDGKTDCQLRLVWPEGDVDWEGTAGVGIHGRSSSGFPKKQYAIELRDDTGLDAPANLFGMGSEADWLLNGMYLDRALFRNKLAYDLFRDMGGFAPESAYVEVTLNGAYSGVYLLTERIDHDRVDQPDDDGTGSAFVLRADESGIASSIQYGHWLPIYPYPVPTGVSERIVDMEARLLADDPTLWDVVSLDSFVDFVILEEALKNNDAYYLSHHLYTDDVGLMRLAPWDLDLTLGQPSYNNNELAEYFILYRPDIIAHPATTALFHDRFVARWWELRGGLLANDAVVARMEAYRSFLGPAIDRNWAAWDITQVPNVGFPLYAVASPDQEYALVESWIQRHLDWMDANIESY